MRAINMLEAKTSLSRLVAVIEDGSEEEIVIARGGRPVARLVPLQKRKTGIRLGVVDGKFVVPDDIDACNPEIEKMSLDKDS